MKLFLGIVLCLSVVNLPFVRGACSWSYSSVNIDDTAVNKEIYTYTADEDFEFTSWEVSQADGGLDYVNALTYFQYSIDAKTFSVQTTDNFNSLNDDAYTDGGNPLSIALRVTLKCSGSSTPSTLLVVVKNTNQNAPKFDHDSYTYSLPMPIMPKTDFSLYGDEIAATDIDFSTSLITFSVDPDDFTVTSSKTGNKTFQAVFSAKNILRFTESQIYTLTATDSGSPAQSSTAKITLNVDPTTGLDSPSFSNSYYSYNCSAGTTPSLTPITGDIIVESDKSDKATYVLSGEHADLFVLDFTNTSKTFTITLNSDASWPADVSSPIILTLSYTTDVTINAVILITIVNAESLPEFTSDYYVGTYDTDTDQISWNVPIKVSGATKVEVTGDKSSLFTLNQATYELTPTNPLSKSDFDDNLNLFLTLVASSSSGDARVTVVISLLTQSELKFDSVYYHGTYSIENEKGVVTLDDDVGFSDITDFSGITIVVDDSYIDNFKIELESSKWKVTVLQALDTTVLNSNSELAIPMTATLTGESAKAILILKLPDKVEITFSSPYYTANYVKGSGTDSDTVVLGSDIILEGADASGITITPEAYSDNFKIELESSKWKVTVLEALNTTILNDNSELTISITATLTGGGSAMATAVLLLKLPDKAEVKFSSPYYTANYVKGTGTDLDSVVLDTDIILEGADASGITITPEGYDNNFVVDYNSDSATYKVTVEKNLNSSILDSETELIIIINAAETDESIIGRAVLVLKLPEITSFNFENKYYAANYIIDTISEATVKFIDDTIKISTANSDKVEFTFEGYNDNFEMTFNSVSSAYDITVKSHLNSSILASETQLTITITADDTDTGSTASTILVLLLPEKLPLNFEDEYYAAEYITDSTSQASVAFTDDSIKITGADFSKIEFIFEGYNDNFKMEYDSGSSVYWVNVTENLNSSILASGTQLIITVTAAEIETGSAASTVLVLKLPDKTTSLNFEHTHYSAQYVVDSTSQASVEFTDDNIKITGAGFSEMEYTFEGYNDNFKMDYDSGSSVYGITVKENLNSSILASETQLIITVTATEIETGSTARTVLVLKMPDKTTSFNFEHTYYSAEYIVDTTSQASVEFTDNTINISGADFNKIEFTFEGYNDNFKMDYDSVSSVYGITVKANLNSSILASETELIITVTATEIETGSTARTVLVLKMPDTTSSLNFELDYYAAEYSVDSSSDASVKFTDGGIKITGSDLNNVEFTFEGYNDNFEMAYNPTSATYDINVKNNLNSSVIDVNEQLVITITASSSGATDTTILALKLPELSINFEEQHYIAEYLVSLTGASVQLDKDIIIKDDNSLQLQFSFEGYEHNFNLELNSTTEAYNVIVSEPLDEYVLSHNTQLIITLTASSDVPVLSASTVLVLTLPARNVNFVKAFENDYYEATYTQSTTSSNDQIELVTDIIIKSADFAEVKLKFEGYDENFVGSCDSGTLKCTVTVQKNLNSSILSSDTEVLPITLTASNEDGSSTGITVLLIKLPSKSSTFSFDKQHYYAVYTIEKTDNEKATVTLNDTISFDGADSADISSIVADEYPDEFGFTFDSKWSLIVNTNLASEILSKNTELITSLIATKTDQTDSSKATLVIKLPDKATMAFLNPQYSAKYVIDDSGTASVTLTDSTEIKTMDDTVQITLDSYSENFGVTLDSNSKWIINIIKPLDASVFTENAQLKLLMTITKASVNYGTSALVIKLPDPSFTQGFYTVTYSDDNGGSVSSSEDIEIVNVEPSDIQVNLSKYNEYMYTDLVDGKWIIKLGTPLPAEITQNYEILLITLEAIRKSDSTQLATSTLLIKLPDVNLTDTPKFTQFTFYGDYKNSSDKSTVELKDFIGFTNSDTVTVSSVSFQEGSSDYVANFKLNQRADGTYDIEVSTNLAEDVLEKETSIVLTLVASTDEGKEGYAALIITLPKIPRETSVQLKNEEILYTGTYANGTFTSQDISLEIDSTDDTQISVEITNDMELDNKYFTYTYKNKVLSINIDDLPEEILNNYSVIPLKLAITDNSTGDTIHAVLNVNIKNNSSDDGGGGTDATDSDRKALFIAVIILACLLIAVIIATVLLWYFKIRRNTKYAEMEEEEFEKPTTKPTVFQKNLNRQTSTSVPSNSVLRRPTGLPVGFINPASPTEDTSSDFEVLPIPEPTPENERKVVFDDHVQNIEDYMVDDENPSENLQNVADRRPTQFVFAYPMEAVLDDSSERRESSDYDGIDPEKKKSVVFDENVERMDIDRSDDEDNENEENDSSDDENTEDEDRKKFKSELEVKLKEQLANEIFNETI